MTQWTATANGWCDEAVGSRHQRAVTCDQAAALADLADDGAVVVGTVLAVLVLGALHGMLTAIGLSVIDAMRRFSSPVVGCPLELDHRLLARIDAKGLGAPGRMFWRVADAVRALLLTNAA